MENTTVIFLYVPLDIHFLIHRVHSIFFYQHKHYRPTESSRSTCHATFLNIKCFDALASESLNAGCHTSREREIFIRYHERHQDNIHLGCYPLEIKYK